MTEEYREKKIESLLNLRRGKKSSVTKRINELERLISEGGSRTKIKVLHKALKNVQDALITVCNELNELRTPSAADIDWLEDIDHKIDSCSGEVQDYLEARKDDPPSTASLTKS